MKDGIYKGKGYEFHYRNHNLDREDGPAAIFPDGRMEYWRNGQYHREDAPAVIYPDGRMEWWLNGQRHRGIGPAIVNADGTEMWYQHGKLHREDGPAVQFWDGTEEWWLEGEKLELGEFTLNTAKILQQKLDLMGTEQLNKVAGTVGKILQIRQKLETDPPNKPSSLSDTRFKKFL